MAGILQTCLYYHPLRSLFDARLRLISVQSRELTPCLVYKLLLVRSVIASIEDLEHQILPVLMSYSELAAMVHIRSSSRFANLRQGVQITHIKGMRGGNSRDEQRS
ncbi:hypothetical protein AA313_de0202798 [Arthrobotrys entomopaga]|nr:hypothetical protein AA313_de0202798 [Arthrobotrys entomopaga]